jgi:3-hydroxybutyryl-CoA dehydrogenase
MNNTTTFSIAILGCGVMGQGIAQLALMAGHHVWLFDVREGAADAARTNIDEIFAKLEKKGKVSHEQVQLMRSKLYLCTDLSMLAKVNLIIEAVIEDLDVKKKILQDIEHVVDKEALIASNTSSFSITQLASHLHHPQRFAGLHFFNPVPLMKLVEVIPGLRTQAETTKQLRDLVTGWGHQGLVVKDSPGFLVNHVGRGYSTEALRLLNEGVASVAQIDQVMRQLARFKMGPFELMDLVGLDVSHPVMESVYHQFYEESRFRPSLHTRQMCQAKLLGKKSGQGFYTYDAFGQKYEPEENPTSISSSLPLSIWISPELEQLLPELTRNIKRIAIEQKINVADDYDAASLCLIAPSFDDASSFCLQKGLDAAQCVAVDSLFYSTQCCVLMSNPSLDKQVLSSAYGLFSLLHEQVIVIRDSLGFIAPRIVAHIINIACEIAQHDIAQPSDIDHAARLALAYPLGPLEWGDKIGVQRIYNLLSALHTQTGDMRYRPSVWLKRRAQLGLSLLKAEQRWH